MGADVRAPLRPLERDEQADLDAWLQALAEGTASSEPVPSA
jgi:hypothetical protein